MNTQPEALRLADYLEADDGLTLSCNDAAAELRRLHQQELAANEWIKKTDWVQGTAQTDELGMHRADVLKQRIDRLHQVKQELLEALKGIADIQNKDWGGDWDEIEEARSIARATIDKATGARCE